MNRAIALACLAGLVAGQPAAAQSARRAGSWETRFGFVLENSAEAEFRGGTKAEFDSDTAFRIGAGYHYTDNLELGLNLGFGTTDYRADVAGDQPGEVFRVKGDLEFTTLTLDATWNILSGPLTPFVVGAIGWNWADTNLASGPPEVGCWWDPWWGYVCTDFQDTRTLDGFTYQLGAGLRHDFSETIALHGSYRMTWIDFEEAKGTPDFDGFQLSFGWKF